MPPPNLAPLTILITGPESSGKTTLARRLAAAVDGLYVPEQARAYLAARGGAYTEADLPVIWARQRAAEEAALTTGASFVVCDTGPVVMKIWAEVRFGRVPPVIAEAAATRPYSLVLLCAPDLAWEPDPLRETPDPNARRELFEQYHALLPSANVIRGKNRIEQGLAAVGRLVKSAGKRNPNTDL